MSVDLKGDHIAALVLHPGWVITRMAPTGKITAEASVEGMVKIITNADMEQSGRFYDYSGVEIPW